MNWLDERLFGWSRASKPRWTRGTRSEPGSSIGTPYDSDQESVTDDGDYDQVCSSLPLPSFPSPPRLPSTPYSCFRPFCSSFSFFSSSSQVIGIFQEHSSSSGLAPPLRRSRSRSIGAGVRQQSYADLQSLKKEKTTGGGKKTPSVGSPMVSPLLGMSALPKMERTEGEVRRRATTGEREVSLAVGIGSERKAEEVS